MSGGHRATTGAGRGLLQVMCEGCGAFGPGKPVDGALTSVRDACPDCGCTSFRDPYED
ncbi:hypothetical protein [Halorussus sp. AFM4]|uniref:hypothetical protein n=1 Tax=Halorussus sp. AFM4 TaxID=3421651 RepID=UPI003EBEE29E